MTPPPDDGATHTVHPVGDHIVWRIIGSREAIDETSARQHQRESGYDPEIYGFDSLRLHGEHDATYSAVWRCSRLPTKLERKGIQ